MHVAAGVSLETLEPDEAQQFKGAHDWFQKVVGSIEVVTGNELSKVYFPVPEICRHFTKGASSTPLAVLCAVWRSRSRCRQYGLNCAERGS